MNEDYLLKIGEVITFCNGHIYNDFIAIVTCLSGVDMFESLFSKFVLLFTSKYTDIYVLRLSVFIKQYNYKES